ncbi:23S rRNA (adenine(2503)-C(8))-methyltransferase Cfr [Brevundimonas sp. S1H14]|uniref:23S rRNA (adenine(2503)-C(8))-methyltransferase Cfr n=1 Tax=Brevundimonas sp. S1H14 TaxID=3078084 RepID=UPI0039ED79FE
MPKTNFRGNEFSALGLNSAYSSKYTRIWQILRDAGAPDFRHRQIFKAIFQDRITRFSDMVALPKPLRLKLATEFGDEILSLKRVATKESEQAEKTLYALPSGERVEAVSLKFQAGWESFCISSQSGCGFGCTFCATGKLGLLRNMTADEITDQLLDFHFHGRTIDSVSFMGMGEALSNVHTFDALRLMTHPALFALSPRRITVSTIGIVPQMERLASDFPQVNLTLSLHTPFNEQRTEMMPISRKYPIPMLMEALDRHVRETRRKTYIAYVLIRGVNDTRDHAKALAKLINARFQNGRLLHVSLITFNEIASAPGSFARSKNSSARLFQNILLQNNVKTTIRASFGNDIDAACGQLSANYASS